MTARADRPAFRFPAAGATAIVGCCLIGECVLVALLAAGAPILPVALAHGALSAAAVILIARAKHDFAAALMLGMAMGTLGPVGLVAAFRGERWAARAAADPSLAGWHEKMTGTPARDPAAELYRDIVEDRAYRPSSIPRSFAGIMASGTVRDRQRVLGLLAKRDDRAHDDLLEAGLRAPELAVRASAAAVVARQDNRQPGGRP